MNKKVISIIMTILVLFSVLSSIKTIKVKAATINIGDYVQMGKYYDEPILWRCVDIDENGPLMLADRILTIKPFDAAGEHRYMDGTLQAVDVNNHRANYGSNLWETSNMRSWLNSTTGNVTWLDGCPPTASAVWNGSNAYATEKGFMADGNFTASERNAIKSVTQKSILNGIDANKLKVGGTTNHIFDAVIFRAVQNFDTTAYYHHVTDKMFLLDVKQIDKVFQNSRTLGSNYYIGKPTQKAVDNSEYKYPLLNASRYWDSWLRTPYADSSAPNSVRVVDSAGIVFNNNAIYIHIGARPAFYMNLSSVIFKSGNGSSELPYVVTGGSEGITSAPSTSTAKPATHTPKHTVPLTPKPSELLTANQLIIGKDNNFFKHSRTVINTYSIGMELYEQLTHGQSKGVKRQILERMESSWGGSCFGIAASQGLVKLGTIQATQIQPGATYYYDFDMDERVRNLVNYYHLSQNLPGIRSARTTVSRPGWNNFIEKNSLIDVLKTITQKAKTIEAGSAPFMFSFLWGDSGHAVIANGYKLMSTGEHRIEIVDSNKQDGYTYVYINEDYSSWRYEGVSYSGLSENTWEMIGFSEYDKFNTIAHITDHSDYFSASQSEKQSADSVFITVINPLLFTILNSLNQKTDYKEDVMSGNLVPKSIDFTIGTDADNPMSGGLIFEFEKSELYSFIPESDSISFSLLDEDEYAYISITGSQLIEVALGNEINIDGSGVNYEMYVSNTTEDVGLIKIVDEDTGNIKLEHIDDGVLLSADSLEGVIISLMYPGKKTVTEINTEKKQVMIVEESGNGEKAIKIYVSENEDGVFDTALASVNPIETTSKEQSEENPSENKPKSNSFMMLFGVGLLIIISAAVIVLVKRKRR